MPTLQPLTQEERRQSNTAVARAALDCWGLIVNRTQQEPWLSFLRGNYRLLKDYSKRYGLAAETCEAILEFMRVYKDQEPKLSGQT